MTPEADSTVESLSSYQGAVAIVTGGGSGIGRAISQEIANRGCRVVLADLNLSGAQAVADEICTRGGQATARALDVTDEAAVDGLVRDTCERLGRLDYMFNNAGVALNGKFADYERAHWQQIVDVNLWGVINGARAAQHCMSQQGFGHIINTASFAGIFPWSTTIPYTATKHAVVGLSTAMRAELADAGIRVSVLCPGTILTPMIEKGASPERWVGAYSQEKLEAFFSSAVGMEPDAFASKALDKIARNRGIIVLPGEYKALWYVNRLSPSLAILLSRKIYQMIMKRVSD